ncbi:protein of unknown function [Anaerovirgula multivorans]|uniref:DUF4179 domain-containing protein n=1 Tax=Anaerovirgula multivorans TaxID=312168 RepID=A0A239F707_9FIRM|nr:DUF4179 domain-containing protein [Anaerovirgula multivorans]SNS52830.1 protein of unknown function [Anaerovirgula multivorans]
MKNSKNIYELLNQMEFNINDYEREELTDMEKKKLKENFRKKRKKKFDFRKIGIIVATLVLTIGIFSQTSFGKNVYAATQSTISEITYSIGKALGIERNIELYGNVVDQIVENNGVEIKLTDVIIDKDELIFSTIVNINKPVDGFMFDHNIFINGKKLRNNGMTGSCGKIDDSETMFVDTYLVDAVGIDTKENIDIKIVFSDLNYFTIKSEDIVEGKVKGKWIFEFTADGSELMADTYVLPLDYSFDIDNQSYILEELRYNPVNQKIRGNVKGKSNGSYQIDLRGYDNLGNEITFYLSSKSGEDFVFKYSNLYKDFSDEITSITLTPYAAKLPEESGRESNDYKQVGEEFTIFLNK